MSKKKEFFPCEEDATDGFVEQNEAIVKVYWSILRNLEEYKKDYKELQKNKKLAGLFTYKWNLHDPIDPKEDNPNPFYFYPDGIPIMPPDSNGVKEGSYCLTIDLDIRQNQTDLVNKIKKIIADEKERFLSGKEAINLIGEERPQSEKHYEKLFFVSEKWAIGRTYNQILDKAEEEGRDFTYDTVDTLCKKIREIKENIYNSAMERISNC